MPKITFIEADGKQHDVDAVTGLSLMKAAQAEGIPGIDGDCGGMCACATCHVYIASEWVGRLPILNDQERDMLELAHDLQPTSRLACQILIGEEIDGLVVSLPKHQR